jgi:hypothetical protein
MCIMTPVSPMGCDRTSAQYKARNPHWEGASQLPGIRIEPKLFVYDAVSKKLTQLATNLPGEMEALEMRSDGLLVVGVHGSRTIYAYDVTRKRVVAAEATHTPYDDVEGIAWPRDCTPAL